MDAVERYECAYPGEVALSGGKACANCGATQDLLRCSRCHQAWFCSVKCQKQYWPFHKSVCRRNDFADAIEATEPKFAKWMRKHGKVAVLKDDEVERLERASQASNGASREEVMSSMYGRSDPKPLPPSYSPEDLKKMKRAEEARLLTQGQAATPADKSWNQISLPPNLGCDCGAYKWTQTQAQVTIFVKLPPSLVFRGAALAKLVKVTLLPNHLSVHINGTFLLGGDLCKEIKCDESTWFIADGILEITLLKRYRRGLTYQKGETNANTFWMSIFTQAKDEESLGLQYPPSSYYETEWRVGDTTGTDYARLKSGTKTEAISAN